MPHTSRRKKPQNYSKKLIHVSADDGWSVVSRKSDDRRLHDDSSSSTRFTNIPPEQLMEQLTISQSSALMQSRLLAPPEPRKAEITLEKLKADYKSILGAWRASGARARMKQILNLQVFAADTENMESQATSHIIRKAICLGLGSLSAPHDSRSQSSIWQLAVFTDIVDHLKAASESESSPQMYAQDPVFNDVDTSLLETCGIEVHHDPDAFDLIDENTFVYAPHYPVALWPARMREGHVSIILGNDISEALPNILDFEGLVEYWKRWNPGKSVEEIPDTGIKEQLQALMGKYDSAGLPEPEDGAHGLNGLRFYWTKQADKD